MDQKMVANVWHRLQMHSSNWPETSMAPYGGKPLKSLLTAVLSTRTDEESTIRAAASLFKLGDTPESILAISIYTLEQTISNVAYPKMKAKYIHEICSRLLEHGGQVPASLPILLGYPGVGYKVATITLINAFGHQDLICVDVHVTRIAHRLGLVPLDIKKPDEIESHLKTILPRNFWAEWNYLMVRFGRAICKPRRPLCKKCPIADSCPQIGVNQKLIMQGEQND